MDCPLYGNGVSKKWWRDRYCDDEYNTPGCFYDGGDCCRKATYWWNNYCTVFSQKCISNVSFNTFSVGLQL